MGQGPTPKTAVPRLREEPVQRKRAQVPQGPLHRKIGGPFPGHEAHTGMFRVPAYMVLLRTGPDVGLQASEAATGGDKAGKGVTPSSIR